MKKDYTHIAMVIDRSGSMTRAWSDVLGGYTQYIEDQKKQAGKCSLTTTVFDTSIDVIEDFTDIQDVNVELNAFPRGGTALLDAIGVTISSVGKKLSNLPEEERPEKVLIIVQTDGLENASKEYRAYRIKEMIKEQETKYNWEFSFIGASLESVNAAESWGFNKDNSAVYSTSNSFETMSLLSEKTSNYRSMECLEKSFAYSTEERSKLVEK